MSTEFKVGDKVVCTYSDNPNITVEQEYLLKKGNYVDLSFVSDDGDDYGFCDCGDGIGVTKLRDAKFEKVEKMEKFKAGDLVFELSFNKGVKLTNLTAYNNKFYPLQSFYDLYTANGFKSEKERGIPNLLHATPENREKLVAIWGEDAVPELPLRGSELTKKLLESHKYVLAWISNKSDKDARLGKNVGVIGRFSFVDGFITQYENEYSFAVPIDPKTGEEVTGGDDE